MTLSGDQFQWPDSSNVHEWNPDIDVECVRDFMNAFDYGRIDDLAVAMRVNND